MTKNYGKSNKGFQKSNENRRAEKLRKLITKRVKSRKGLGPELTKSENEWMSKYSPFG